MWLTFLTTLLNIIDLVLPLLTAVAYWLVGHVARYQGNRLGPQDRSSLFLTILFGRTVITLQTPPVTHGPRASSVQIDCPTAGCAFAWYMVSTADKGPILVDISLAAIYFREWCLVGPGQVSRRAAVGTPAGMDRS